MSQNGTAIATLGMDIQEITIPDPDNKGKELKGFAPVDKEGKYILPKNGKPSPTKADAANFLRQKIVSAMARKAVAFAGNPTRAEDEKLGDNQNLAVVVGRIMAQLAKADDKLLPDKERKLGTPLGWYNLATDKKLQERAIAVLRDAFAERAEFVQQCKAAGLEGLNQMTSGRIGNYLIARILPMPKGIMLQEEEGQIIACTAV